MVADHFSCYVVNKDATGKLRGGIESRRVSELPPGDVLIRVGYSSLNYKDALATQGHPGVAPSMPHVPGIDAVGTVVESGASPWSVGDEVVVTGNELGAPRWGGWAELIRVPAEWVVRLPPTMTAYEAMILGTAGFTAAQCVAAIVLNGVDPSAGEVVVTGATGGVGCLAVKLLAKLGYQVVAVTGKPDQETALRGWGATRIAGRQEVLDETNRPMLSTRWAAAVDTVGGQTLATIVRQTKPYGVVAASGLVGGTDLPLTVYPFILRGVILAGIGSAMLPLDRRREIWRKLSQEWRMEGLADLATTIELADVEQYVQKILRGEVIGRTVVRVSH